MVPSLYRCCIVVERFAGVYLYFTRSLANKVFQSVNYDLGFTSTESSIAENLFFIFKITKFKPHFQMDYFASHLYDIMENDKNLIFVTSQIENRSTFGFYLSLSMLWKSVYRCMGDERSMFRLYPVRCGCFYRVVSSTRTKFLCFRFHSHRISLPSRR